ncbi:hypothetical protein F8388_010926 [Cannabis sativa]|uniref:RNase H type-1 domain-containing protein n=1 Tax=Cannabis sativa TaxID=3483 RepID=A0A7J6HME6_CANSA|nr:hypothetical protein F8388_010926 [Cannabis sativa]KAF4396145.1 hypothetical protein G4B88_020782 [Cannabis sativa]
MEAMWKERNSIVHGQSKNSIWQVLSIINTKIREQLHVVSNEVEDFCAWTPPPESWLCCNCDVSCDDEGMVVATVVRDDQGRIVTIKTERNHLTDPLIGEVVAVCMAAELMIDKKVAHVVFQSDNIETVEAFSNVTGRDCNFKLVNLRSRFQQLCKGLQNWEVGHVPRKCNFMAHNIAKWARENSATGIILCSDLTHEVLIMLRVDCKAGPITTPGFIVTKSIPFSFANFQAPSSAKKLVSENQVSSATTSGVTSLPLAKTALLEDIFLII